ncbi:MAG: ABC transporter permease, partial [Candidatus Eisenbacteria bacterium]|nr:ABC transporter permease [Candidatus Eisenbacteria bacterium]
KTETQGAAPFISTAPHDLTMADAEAIRRRIFGVSRLAPISLGATAAGFGERSRNATVIGTSAEFLEVRKIQIQSGRFLPPELDAPVCVLGAAMARELFRGANPLGQIVRLGEYRFRVIGVVAPRGVSIGVDLDEVVYVPVETGMRIFNKTSLFRLLIEVTAHQRIEEVRQKVVDLLAERHHEEDVTVLTQDSVLSTFNQILRVLTAALAGIATISLGVAGVGIMNVMLVSVAERTREIGLLKALGATGRQIAGVFLVEASLVSTGGGILGLVAGVGGGALLQHFVPEFPARAPWWAIAAALAVSVAVGVAFGWLPARTASRLDPVDALMRRKARG